MEVQLKKRLLSVEEYYKMWEAGILVEDDHVELINGEIVYLSPEGGKHSACISRIAEIIPVILAGKVIMRIQDPIHCSLHSEPEPDIVLAKRRSDHYESGHPGPEDILLVMEVADSSLAVDRNTKLSLYASSQINEYWVINLQDSEIEVYQEPKGDHYSLRRIYSLDESVPLPMGEHIAVRSILSS
ncbi:MAG: Uma2 family endonuclease [Bacteroidota bacterium]